MQKSVFALHIKLFVYQIVSHLVERFLRYRIQNFQKAQNLRTEKIAFKDERLWFCTVTSKLLKIDIRTWSDVSECFLGRHIRCNTSIVMNIGGWAFRKISNFSPHVRHVRSRSDAQHRSNKLACWGAHPYTLLGAISCRQRVFKIQPCIVRQIWAVQRLLLLYLLKWCLNCYKSKTKMPGLQIFMPSSSFSKLSPQLVKNVTGFQQSHKSNFFKRFAQIWNLAMPINHLWIVSSKTFPVLLYTFAWL